MEAIKRRFNVSFWVQSANDPDQSGPLNELGKFGTKWEQRCVIKNRETRK